MDKEKFILETTQSILIELTKVKPLWTCEGQTGHQAIIVKKIVTGLKAGYEEAIKEVK